MVYMGKFDWEEGDVVIHPPETPKDRKRREAVALRADACARACSALLEIPEMDPKTVRGMLMTLTRQATKPAWRNRIPLRSAGALGVDWSEARAMGDPLHVEHVVPVRVLVERMQGPCRDAPAHVFDTAFAPKLLAVCRKSEHLLIGPLVKNHGDVYAQMVDPATPLSDLPRLGRLRYEQSGIELHDIG
jgi:hypothetical protein